MQRCYGSFLFLAQINSRPSKVIGCLDCEADFDLKNPKSKMTDSSHSPSCLYLSSVVAFVLPRLAPQWQPSWLWSLVNIKFLQREADLPQELIDSQKVSMKDSEVDVDNIAMKRNWSENVRMRDCSWSGRWLTIRTARPTPRGPRTSPSLSSGTSPSPDQWSQKHHWFLGWINVSSLNNFVKVQTILSFDIETFGSLNCNICVILITFDMELNFIMQQNTTKTIYNISPRTWTWVGLHIFTSTSLHWYRDIIILLVIWKQSHQSIIEM